MMENILIVIMCVVCLAVGVLVWWIENGPRKNGDNKEKTEDSKSGEEEQ